MVINSQIVKTRAGLIDGKEVYFFTLINGAGNKITITNFGGIISSWIVADKNGNEIDCVIGFNDLKSYLQPHPYFGALIGRYANRIANGTFALNGTEYKLAANNAPNHLHGGEKGFDKVVWDVEIIDDKILQLTYLSKDGEEGYPGNLFVTVSYTFTSGNELIIKYKAKTDKPTPVNLTNHCYFNLTGSPANKIHNHKLFINASFVKAVDESQIPTGEIIEVKKTAFDFSSPQQIREMDFDHSYILKTKGQDIIHAATVTEQSTGIQLKVFTTEPAMQFYTGNHLDGSFINKDGAAINKHTAFCLETQHYPDSPNQPHFPNTILQPGNRYHSITIYQLNVL